MNDKKGILQIRLVLGINNYNYFIRIERSAAT